MNIVALAVIGFGVVVLVVMQLCDGLPHRAFYSRRAFEPRPLTWDEQNTLPWVDVEPREDRPAELPPVRLPGQMLRPGRELDRRW